MKLYKTNAGVTLIELMITVAVIGILSAIAIPAYQDYVKRGNIPDATSTLAAKRVRLEQYFQDNRKYTGAPECDNDTTSGKYFDFQCAVETDTTYTLKATGKGSMAGFEYSIDHKNDKSTAITGVSGWTGNGSCWVTKKGGQC